MKTAQILFLFFLIFEASPTHGSVFAEDRDPDDVIDSIGQTPDSHPPLLSFSPSREDFSQGYVSSSFGTGDEVARGIVFESDGRFWVAGKCYDSTSFTDICIARYLRSGTLDTSFGTTGKIRTTFGNVDDWAHAIRLQSDGAALVAGRASNGTNLDFAILRYVSNGNLDTSWGTIGAVRTSFGTSLEIARGLRIDADGRAVVGGYSYQSAGQMNGVIARYDTDGSLDTSFSTRGWIVVSFGTDHSTVVNVDISSAGEILFAGGHFVSDWDATIGRLTSDGQLDSSFATQGFAIFSFGTAQDFTYSARYTSLGQISFIGSRQGAVRLHQLVGRLTTNGGLDTAFNSSGYFSGTVFGSDAAFLAQVVQTEGRVVAAGFYRNGTGTAASEFMSMRFVSNGALSNWTYSGAALSLGTTADEAIAIAEWNGRDLVAVGKKAVGDLDFGIARVNGGRLGVPAMVDHSFYSDGNLIVSAPEAGLINIIHLVRQEASGKHIVFGANLANKFVAYRYEEDFSSLDTSFSTDGSAVYTTGSAKAVLQQLDGKWVAAGVRSTGRPAVFRINTNGTPDTSFQTTGQLMVSLASFGGSYQFVALDFQTGGQIVLGSESTLYKPGAVLVRLNSDGTLDTSFNTTGLRYASDAMSSAFVWPKLVSLESDSSILVAGYLSDGFESRAVVLRYLTDGTLDTSFSTKGFSLFHLFYGDTQTQTAARDESGRLLLAGYTGPDYAHASMGWVARVLSNGTLDSSFSTRGWLIDNLEYYNEFRSIEFASSGKILLGEGPLTAGLLRISSNGEVDSAFGTSGYTRVTATTFGHWTSRTSSEAYGFVGRTIFRLLP